MRRSICVAAIGLCAAISTSAATAEQDALDPAAAQRFAALALKCLHQEYPNHLSHEMAGDDDARAPRQLHPAFFGCFDWHSNVHAHWLLVRLLRLTPGAPFAGQARAEIARSLDPENIAGEVGYFKHEGRASFERPYGLAWLLELSAELREWDDRQGQAWAANLKPLETEAAARLKTWIPKLHYPIRIGEHDQTAFSFGLIWDWAGVAHDADMRAVLADAARRFYAKDRDCPITYEPSGEDFLSPCLAEADFMRRVQPPAEFAAWLSKFLPSIPTGGAAKPGHSGGAYEGGADAHAVAHGRADGADWLVPGVVTDRADPKLAHVDGLNLSRAWMLEGIAHALPAGDPRKAVLEAAASRHREAALPEVTGEHYEGGHWLGTFAVYLISRAGMER